MSQTKEALCQPYQSYHRLLEYYLYNNKPIDYFSQKKCKFINRSIRSTLWALIILVVFMITLIVVYSSLYDQNNDDNHDIEITNRIMISIFFILSIIYLAVFHYYQLYIPHTEIFFKYTLFFISIMIIIGPMTIFKEKSKPFPFYPLVFFSFMFFYYLFDLFSLFVL